MEGVDNAWEQKKFKASLPLQVRQGKMLENTTREATRQSEQCWAAHQI